MTKCKSYIIVVYLSLLVAACGDGGGDTVKPDDKTPSPVVSTNPSSGATDIPVDAVITATFREDMDSLTVNNTTFTLQYNPPVSGTVTYDKITRIATFIPDSLLALATTYTATITTGVKNLSGTPPACRSRARPTATQPAMTARSSRASSGRRHGLTTMGMGR
jgi:PBP1b-binding outer membrane lipoprotein LpoB